MFELMEALDRIHINPGQLLYCKNGETVLIKEVVYNSMLIQYKGSLYIRKVSESWNISLFDAPYDENKNYYNIFGYDRSGYDKDGYSKSGFNRSGFDRTGYNRFGFNLAGYDKEGFNREGYNEEGYDKNGYNKKGFDRDEYDRAGFNSSGYNRDGFDRNGFDKNGFNKLGFNQKGYDREGFNKNGYTAEGINREGFSWIEIAERLRDGEEEIINGNLCANVGILLTCKECKSTFLLPFGEFSWFQAKGFSTPKRCPPCRKKRKQEKEKYDGLRETMNRSENRRMTGRKMAYRYNGPYEP